MSISILKWLKNSSITKKLYFVVGTMTFLSILALFTLWFSINTLSAIRAFISAESLVSKAQKRAVYHLEKYSHTFNENYYIEFQELLKIPLGDRKALIEISKNKPNFEIAREGLIEGHNHPEDVDGMIKLFIRFRNISYIQKANDIWKEGDSIFSRFISVSEKLHNEINSEFPSNVKVGLILSEISDIDDKLSLLEDEFSYTLGDSARWLEHFILEILFIAGLVVNLIGLFFVFSINLQITRGINEIIRIANKVAKVDFSDRAKIYSNDEIGTLALAFNKMTDDLQQTINQKNRVEIELKDKTNELVRSNTDLEQFAYVASHDLQEPLRMVTSYVQLLESRYKDKLDQEGKEFIAFAVDGTNRMKNLIHSLLEYSRVNKVRPFEHIDLNLLLVKVLQDLSSQIKENNAVIKIDKLPEIDGDPVLIAQLFQNLISNAIKFRGAKIPEISISGKKEDKEYLFTVKDNGIGIPMEVKDKVFDIFQRFHSKEKYPGTGMGLAICKKIVKLHGGEMWLDSEIDKGSTFYFTIKQLK